MSINRFKLVKRHNPITNKLDAFSPFSVGNGDFAFTADITGLQSFPEYYTKGIPLCTQSQWGWHTTPVPKGVDPKDYQYQTYETYGRKVPYASRDKGQKALYNWMRQNPHRLHLGRIGLQIQLKNGRKAEIQDIENIYQKLDLWTGILHSSFSVEGIPVKVETVCHPTKDILGISVDSPLIKENRLFILYDFPFASYKKEAADWMSPDRHNTEIIGWSEKKVELLRIMDKNRHFVNIKFSQNVTITEKRKNTFIFKATEKMDNICIVTEFSPIFIREELPSYKKVMEGSTQSWEKFWMEGGVIELVESKDSRAMELERRIVLSQYVTALQCAGTIPPQETGLTCNSWYGKIHLEMHFWHAAHFPLWGRPQLLERSLWWYKSIMIKARTLAKMQGYKGVRWPKMVDEKGNDGPSPIAPFLIWQQPHPIFYAELCYRTHRNLETLEIYKDIVFNTAHFIASYAHYDKAEDRFVLGPPVIPAQENHKAEETINPTFELEYWVFGLRLAQEWRQRLGLPKNPRWEEVILKMSKLPVGEGVYLSHEKCSDTFTKYNVDHPSMLGALGILPGKLVDRDTMRRTLHMVIKDWNWNETWGWDYPMVAMTAARLGESSLAIDVLLMNVPKNEYLPNGHNRQGLRNDLPIYLPGNGGLLLAVGMMAAGWDGGPEYHAPGFPRDGSWVVKWEGLSPLI